MGGSALESLSLFTQSGGDTFIHCTVFSIDNYFYSWRLAVLGCVHTKELSRVQSSPARLTKTWQWLCGLLTMAAAAVHTHQQSQVESHESCRVRSLDAACSIFVSRTLVIGLLSWKNGCGKDYSFSYGPWGNLRRLALWTPELRLTLMMMFITTKTTAPQTTVIMFLLLLGLLFKVCVCYFWHSSEWRPTVSWLQIKDSAVCL